MGADYKNFLKENMSDELAVKCRLFSSFDTFYKGVYPGNES